MVNATAVVTGTSIGLPTPIVSYNVQFGGWITDGTAFFNFFDSVSIPFSVNFKNADKLVREAMAASALAVSSLVIKPEDIYIPFS